MSRLRFNQVYFFLMLAAFLCAFVIPPRWSDTSRLRAAAILNPLSIWTHQAPPRPTPVITLDKPSPAPKLAAAGARAARVAVVGVDSSGRDALLVASSNGDQARAVIYAGGLAGRLDGTRVRLITDAGFAVTGAFVRFTDSGPVRISAPTPLVRGQGRGEIAVVGMRFSDYSAARLATGDWVVLDDSDWPAAVQGARLGQIISAAESRTAPGFEDISLAPAAPLTSLHDVWIVK